MAIRVRWSDDTEQMWDTGSHWRPATDGRSFLICDSQDKAIAVVPDFHVRFIDQISDTAAA